jgi:hypothetical protein
MIPSKELIVTVSQRMVASLAPAESPLAATTLVDWLLGKNLAILFLFTRQLG